MVDNRFKARWPSWWQKEKKKKKKEHVAWGGGETSGWVPGGNFAANLNNNQPNSVFRSRTIFVARRLIEGTDRRRSSTFLRCNTDVPFCVASRRSLWLHEAIPDSLIGWMKKKEKKKNWQRDDSRKEIFQTAKIPTRA